MIKLPNKCIGPQSPVYIIAEMACAHDGDIVKSKKLIDAAVAAKADAVQLQFFSPDDLVTPDHEVFGLLHQINFSRQEWQEIYEYARKFDIHVFACTYDLPSAEMALDFGVDGIKLNSSDLSNPELLKLVAQSGKPFTLGTGASTLEEISEAVNVALSYGNDKIIIMHGVQNFPTDIENAHIHKIGIFKELFPFPVGFQDHTDASHPFSRVVDLLAVGVGASVIEKHITLDRSAKGTDYQAALEPEEFKLFVSQIRTAQTAMGPSMLRPLSDSDIQYRKFQKKSIVANRNLEKGETLSRNDVSFLRGSSSGLAPSLFQQIEGKVLLTDIYIYETVNLEDLE